MPFALHKRMKQNLHIVAVNLKSKIHLVEYIWTYFRSAFAPGSVGIEFVVKEQSGNLLVQLLSGILPDSTLSTSLLKRGTAACLLTPFGTNLFHRTVEINKELL